MRRQDSYLYQLGQVECIQHIDGYGQIYRLRVRVVARQEELILDNYTPIQHHI